MNVLNVSNSDRDPFEALDVDIDSQRRRDDEGSGGVKASYSQEVPGRATISIFSVSFLYYVPSTPCFLFVLWAWIIMGCIMTFMGLNWTPNLDCVLAKKTRLTNVKNVKPNKTVYLVTRPKQNNIVNKASTKTGLPYEIISPTIRLLKEALLLRVKMLLVIIGSWWINLKMSWRRKQQPLIKLCHQLL